MALGAGARTVVGTTKRTMRPVVVGAAIGVAAALGVRSSSTATGSDIHIAGYW